MQQATPSTPVIVGNPFAPTGRGFTALSHFRALREAGIPVSICDVISRQHLQQPGSPIEVELGDCLVSKPGNSINIFHWNADEVAPGLERLGYQLRDGAYNIIYPFWELGRFPKEWLKVFAQFDEIWAPSGFVEKSLRNAGAGPLVHMPMPIGVRLSSMLGRDHFGLSDRSYVFLFFFDFRSFVARKNPHGLLKMFERVLSSNPLADFRLLIKVHGTGISEKAASDYRHFVQECQTGPLADRITLVDRVYSDNEMHNLIRCCDCFVSLHRSEGFGLGLAEAMYLGKPVIGTAYSGNMDFMTADNSCLVDFHLVPVGDGQYPHWQGQAWAEPDVDQAAAFAAKLLDNPGFGRELGRRASQHMRSRFSYLAMGLRYAERLRAIAEPQPGAIAEPGPAV